MVSIYHVCRLGSSLYSPQRVCKWVSSWPAQRLLTPFPKIAGTRTPPVPNCGARAAIFSSWRQQVYPRSVYTFISVLPPKLVRSILVLLCTAAALVVCSAACHAAALTLFRIMYMEPSSDPGPGFVLGTLGAACTVAPVLVLLCCNACARCAALCEPTGSTGQWFLMYTQ